MFDIRFGKRLLCTFICCLILSQQQVYADISSIPNTDSSAAYQAAEILQIRTEVDRLLRLEKEFGQQTSATEEILSLRAFILRKIFAGVLDVRRACNKVEIELAYTYAIMQREQHKQANVNQFLNLLNFAQLSVLYTLEPYSRINNQFTQSAVLTCVGAGLAIGFPIIGIVYNKFSKARDTAPPKFLANVLDGGPVGTSELPQLIQRFFDSHSPEGQISRREAMYALWKKRFGVDASKKGSLCSLSDGGGKGLGLLNVRLGLLWSLHTFIEDFDPELLALLKLVQAPARSPLSTGGDGLNALGLRPGAIEAARLLKIQPTVEELLRLNRENADNIRKSELELELQEHVLVGLLDICIATDKIDGELNYAYDVVLSTLLARRGKGLQLNFEANFVQTGVFGAIAGLLFLKGYPNAGNEMFVIQSSIGTALSGLALWQMRGGSRKLDTRANSLAQFFNPDPKNEYHFSPLVSDFMKAPAPESNSGKSRSEFLIERWKERRVATFRVDSTKNQEKLAAMSPSKSDRIAIVRNRIDLMHSLKARLEEFDSELLDLLDATEPIAPIYNVPASEITTQRLNPPARAMVNVLGIQPYVEHLTAGGGTMASKNELMKDQLFLTRRILSSALDARRAVSQLDLQIATETTARDRIIRLRDLAINLTNNANFFQLGILGIIIDGPLFLSTNPTYNLYGNRLNIVSGYLVGGLAGLTVLEQPGGLRLSKAEPNTLGSVFGIKSPGNCQLSPTISKFLNSVSPSSIDGLTRKDELIAYWKKTKVVSVAANRLATQEKLAANGPSHHFWNETIKLMTNRIRMLYDVRAVIDLMNVGLADLLRAID